MAQATTLEALADRQVPAWYQDAKLGVFIHWGLYSVPAWAPLGGDIRRQVAEHGWEHMFRNNPYSEWYLNSLRLDGSPTRGYHEATYGAAFGYDDFVPSFEDGSESMDADAWAQLFRRIGARYVVLTTKHHDGYLLWPSALTSPHRPAGYASRDLVGEVVAAARRQGMRAGLYYSGGLDWTFDERPIAGYMDVYSTIVQVSVRLVRHRSLAGAGGTLRTIDPVERHRGAARIRSRGPVRPLLRRRSGWGRQRPMGTRAADSRSLARESTSTRRPAATTTSPRPSTPRTKR